jgi:hypothetical protein
MRSSFFTLILIAMLMFMVGTASNFAFAATPTSGYVQYSITMGSQGSSTLKTVIVTESSQSSGQSGFVNLTLALSSNMLNFSYSKDVNSSSLPEIFPYLSGLTNQSVSYQVRGISISASIANTGGSQVIFGNESYQATNYQVSLAATNSTSGNFVSATGSIVTMPSGLVDSFQFVINGTTSVNAKLLSTNLSLTDPPDNVNTLGASMLGVGVIVAIAFAVPTVFKRVKHRGNPNPGSADEIEGQQQSGDEKEKDSEEKPSYWVD